MHARRNRRRLRRAVVVTLLGMLGCVPSASAERTFTQRYAFGGTGDVTQVGNTLLTCNDGGSTPDTACVNARAGTGTGGALNNNTYNSANVDADGVAGTVNSSSATLSLPAGATVRFAGLYFGGRATSATASDAVKQAVAFRVGGGPYTTYNATGADNTTAFDTATPTGADTTAPFYAGFVNVTSVVQANGSGTYWAGNVESDVGVKDRAAGWSLVVAYSRPSETRRQLYVFDGLQQVATSTARSIVLNDLATPPSGTVDGRIGLVSNEGDLGATGDTLSVGSTAITDARNPADNVFNSSIANNAARFTAKTPDYANQLGWDVDQIGLPAGAIAAGATGATLNLATTGDLFLPSVVTLATRAETDPPETTLDAVPGATSTATPTFTFSSSEAGSTFECRVDAAAFAPCSSPTTVTALAEGSHTFQVRGIDRVDNVDPTPASATFTVDTTAPTATITGGPAGPTKVTRPAFTFTSSESGTFVCSVDDDDVTTSCSSPFVPGAALADSAHTFRVRSRDAVGNLSPVQTRTFVVDSTAPDTTISSGPADNGFSTTATPAFTFASSEGAGSTLECRVDAGDFSACNGGSYTTEALVDGTHTFTVRATDAADNTDPSPASRTFTVDTAAPDTTITAPTEGALVATTTPSIAFTATENDSTLECSVDDSAGYSACSSPASPTLGQGAHTVRVRAVDAAGNVDPTPAVRTFTVDTVAPDTTITAGPAAGGSSPTATPTFAFAATETDATFECRVDAGAYTACDDGTRTLPTLSEGSHSFTVRATDRAGNVDASPATRTFDVDTVAPDTTITSGVVHNGVTRDATPSLGFTGSETGSTFECAVDGGAYASCTSPKTLAALADGAHTFRVRATDPAGNTDPTAAVRAFLVDTDAPETGATGPDSPTNDPTASVSFSASETGATFECALDGGPFAACTSPLETDLLVDGSHTVRVRATDAAGNTDATPASVVFVVDTAAPALAVTGGPASGDRIADATPTFAFSAEAGASVSCSVDTGTAAACSSPLATSQLADGTHTVRIEARDAAGNARAQTRTFVVDTTGPAAAITGPAADGETNDATPTLAFSSPEAGASFECAVDGGAFQTCSAPFTTPTLPEGDHIVRVRAVDALGNRGDAVTRALRVDVTAPDTTITGPAAGALLATATPAITFSSPETGTTFECSVDAATFTSCVAPLTTSRLADGHHAVRVRAVDTAGNLDATPAVVAFVIDTTPPATTGSGPSGVVREARPPVTFASPDAGARFQCRTDGGAWLACGSPWRPGVLPDGDHVIEARAVDAAGNADPTPVLLRFAVDTGPPDTVVDGPTGVVAAGAATFRLGSSETDVRYECSLDGAAFAACRSPFTPVVRTAGEHTLLARAIDAQNGRDATPATIRWTVAGAATTARGLAPTPTPAAPVTPSATADLGSLPGSLVAAARCQRLAGPGFVKTRSPRGIGLVVVRMRSNATSPPGTPLRLTLARTGRRTTAVGYTLDGRRVRSGGAAPFRLTLEPAQLVTRTRHRIRATFTARDGRRTTYRFSFRTLRCNAVLSVSQSRARQGTVVRLRVDSVRALGTTSFRVPGRALRRLDPTRALRLRLRGTGDRRRSFVFRRLADGRLAGPERAPRVRVSRTGLTVSGLPAGTGILRADLRTRTGPVGGGRRTTVRARVSTGGRTVDLQTTTRAGFGR